MNNILCSTDWQCFPPALVSAPLLPSCFSPSVAEGEESMGEGKQWSHMGLSRGTAANRDCDAVKRISFTVRP